MSSNINLKTCSYCNQNTFGMHEKKCPLYNEIELIETDNAIYEIKTLDWLGDER